VHVGAAAALSVAGVTTFGVIQSMAGPIATATSLVPIPPCRLLDTRSGSDNVGARSGPIGANQSITVAVRGVNGNCNIPVTATAIQTNLTSVNPTADSFLTIYAADVVPRPTTSNLNWLAFTAPNPNAGTVSLSASGAITAYNLTGTVDLIVDIVGYYEPTTAGSIGPTGANGTNGTIGTPGSNGTNGTNGTSGAAGTPGTAGASGPQFGRTLTFSSAVDTVGTVGTDASIAVGFTGNPIVSYRDVTNTSVRVTACNEPMCMNLDETSTTVDNAADVGRYTSISIGADTFPIISYFDVTNGNLKVVKCDDRLCASGTFAVNSVDTVGTVGSFTSLAIGADGLPVISYYDTTNTSLKIAKCNDVACAGNDETLTTVDNAADVGQYTSLTIGADGMPIVSYYDVTSSRLKIVKCNDAACSGTGEVTTTIDSALMGRFSSITIGTDANPVVAYQDGTTFGLRVARCNDPACVGANEQFSAVTSSANSGDSPSIVIGANGNPVVSYIDIGAGTLRMVECNDPACAGLDETFTTLGNGSASGSGTAITVGPDANPVIAHQDSVGLDLSVVKVTHTSWTRNGWDD
jgi:hypothetical protein